MFLCNSQTTYFPQPPLRGANHKPLYGGDVMPTCSAVGKGSLGSGGEQAIGPLRHVPVHVSCSSGIPGSASSPPPGPSPPLPFSPAGSLDTPSRWGPVPWHTFSSHSVASPAGPFSAASGPHRSRGFLSPQRMPGQQDLRNPLSRSPPSPHSGFALHPWANKSAPGQGPNAQARPEAPSRGSQAHSSTV